MTLKAKPTFDGVRNAIQVGTRYLQSWLAGRGAVAPGPPADTTGHGLRAQPAGQAQARGRPPPARVAPPAAS
jgi:hypothetical protein